MNELDECKLCPFECKVNRNEGKIGRCKARNKVKIGLYSLHYDEEPCISGKNGSGTVFFSNCNLKCIFCQNYKISCESKGEEITTNELSEIFLKLQEKGANNINLVTAVPYVMQIIEAIKIARNNGLIIPILYNTSGYESIETLKLATRLSNVTNYREVTTKALLEMKRQVGKNIYDENGILKRGMIIRHLVLPENIQNSKEVLKWIKNNMGDDITISLMAQYFPTYKALEDNQINRKLTPDEYNEIEEYLYKLNIDNGYIQDLEEEEEKYVPKF